MAIIKLTRQLANQIAAGEVVERPASVVKELVENSLDAEATRVEIDIEQGGSKLIRIVDNGLGIAQHDLQLALERHATSKIEKLADLEAILSFGFRGEALASMSAVSRLTLSSKPKTQQQAWRAYTQGRDMEVQLQPCAHPKGTTVEVADLFFNTPARRRFLKADKTEFSHIDEWLKRLSLVRKDVAFQLRHQGKVVRRYPVAQTPEAWQQRLQQVCGREFAQQAVEVACDHEKIKVLGYVQVHHQDKAPLQYMYVNGRIIRDRMLMHAVKQAHLNLQSDQSLSYILMLEIEPSEVDINVHPAKHEVRFHDTRSVHAFLVQALSSAIVQTAHVSPVSAQEKAPEVLNTVPNKEVTAVKQSLHHTDLPQHAERAHKAQSTSFKTSSASEHPTASQTTHRPQPFSYSVQDTVSAYKRLAHTQTEHKASEPLVLADQYFVHAIADALYVVPIQKAYRQVLDVELKDKIAEGLVAQPLLLPVSIELDARLVQGLEQHMFLLHKFGFFWKVKGKCVILLKVSHYLRHLDVSDFFVTWLTYLVEKKEAYSDAEGFVSILSQYVSDVSSIWQRWLNLPAETLDQRLAAGFHIPWCNFIK
tara:strand:+ start:6344 stop:8119 length:1776 start_codon:yes stop_codon:yes gene_type:complete